MKWRIQIMFDIILCLRSFPYLINFGQAHVFDVICFCLSFPANKCAFFNLFLFLLYYLFASEVRKTSGLLLLLMLLVVFALEGCCCCCFLIYAVSI